MNSQRFAALLFLSVLLTMPAATVITPPTYNPDVMALDLDASASVNGTAPFTYQWYRGTATQPLKVKIPAPEGVQPTLTLRSTSPAGIYCCVVSNSAGSVQFPGTRFSLTTSKTATELTVTMKKK